VDDRAAGSTVGKGYGFADFISSAVQGRAAPGLTAELMFLVLADLADLAFFFIGRLPNVVGRDLAVAHCAYVVLDVSGFNTLDDKTAAK
jgi:hypothetical protein